MIIKRINYTNNTKITALKADSIENFIWIAFQKDNSYCILEKQYAFNPLQTFFSINRYVDEIKSIAFTTDNVYLAYEDDELFGEKLNKNNPITNYSEIDRPSGVNESPIQVITNNSNVWFLTPGNITGNNAKLFRYNETPILQETIDLVTVTNAKSFIIDSNNDIWIITYNSPAELIRVYAITGGWDYDITVIN